MRIHSDVISYTQTIRNAAHAAGTRCEILNPHGSRKRANAFEVQLSGSSRYSAQSGQWKAATWDEWGNVIDALFKIDPKAIIGYYDGRDDFITKTQSEYDRNLRYVQRPNMTAPWLGE